MAYQIELMCIGKDHYPLLEAAAKNLNAVQHEFQFRLTSKPQRQSSLSFERAKYYTPDIWEFLQTHRKSFRGNRPYIIAFVDAPLASTELKNLFGSHRGEDGLAVATLFQSAQYVSEAKRYCCYWMVRYAMSFVNPLIKAHNDPERKHCYFHMKMYKPDIRASMDTGGLCDACLEQLENPSDATIAKPLSAEENHALKQMRALVSGDFPHALIMKGGGVKGLAFAGALQEIEKYFWFDVHVGASAGAITAVLLAANYSPTEMVDLLSRKRFRDFMDSWLLRTPLNLMFKRGLFPGEHFRLWMADLLGKKIPGVSEIKMSDLPRVMEKDAVIYACRSGKGTVVFDSRGEGKDTGAAFAARCSMSIPIFFFPQQIEGRQVFDGGLRNNFPLSRFLQKEPNKPFVALYLGKPDNAGRRWFWSELLDIWISGEEREAVDSHADSVVVIDTSPIGMVDFGLTDKEKEFLLNVGKAAALRFLHSRKLDNGPDAVAVQNAHNEAEDLRRLVLKTRRGKRLRRILVMLAAVIVIAILGYWVWLLLL